MSYLNNTFEKDIKKINHNIYTTVIALEKNKVLQNSKN
jgi:hypothetical protein